MSSICFVSWPTRYIENQLGDNATQEDQSLEVFPTIVVPDIVVAQDDVGVVYVIHFRPLFGL